MGKAALAIFLFESWTIHSMYVKYFGKSYGISAAEFLSKASLEDIIKMRHHTISGFLSLCIMTMSRLFGVN